MYSTTTRLLSNTTIRQHCHEWKGPGKAENCDDLLAERAWGKEVIIYYLMYQGGANRKNQSMFSDVIVIGHTQVSLITLRSAPLLYRGQG